MIPHLSHALRRLRRAPIFTAAAVLSLGLGIGATTGVFSLIDGVLLQPLPYPDAGRLVAISHTLEIPAILRVEQSDAAFLHYRGQNRTLAGSGLWQATAVNVGSGATAGHMTAARMTASTFDVLGVAPLRGRFFRPGEDAPGAPLVVVLSEALWQRQFGRDPRAIGARIDVDGISREIVGIMPRGFQFPAAATQLWIPMVVDPAHTASAAFDFGSVARLGPGVSIDAARADLQRLLPSVPEEFPGRLTAQAIQVTKMKVVVRPLRDVVVGDIGTTLWPVFGAAFLLLLVACANVANLLIVRSTARQRETAVRRALGAGRRAIAMDFVAEGLLLAAGGAALGLALAAAAVGVLRSLDTGLSIPRLGEVGINAGVLAATGLIALGVTLVLALLPMLTHNEQSVLAPGGGRGVTAGLGMQRALRGLVVLQVAMALVLVASAGLMVRSFARLASVEPGFNPRDGYSFRVALPETVTPTPLATATLVGSLTDRLAALPGVRAAGAISRLPLDEEGRSDSAVFLEGRPLPPGVMPGIHQVYMATPGAFAALGIPFVDGGTFSSFDPGAAPLQIVVSRAFANRYWPGTSALGRRLVVAPRGPFYSVVGVTGDFHASRLDGPPDEVMFLPMVTAPGPGAPDGSAPAARFTPRNVAFVVRTAGENPAIADRVRNVLMAEAPGVPAYRGRALSELLDDASARTRFTTRLLALASGTALLLGALGFYGVLAYVVSLRRREIAVRIALGARPADVRAMITRQAAVLTGIGLVTGLAAAVAVTRLLKSVLYGVTPTDPVTLVLSVAVIGLVTGAASWIPARRAAAVDPVEAMRSEF